MTIETQVAALITATNDLTNSVNSKMGQIDAAVVAMQALVEGLPNRLLGYRTVFVDLISGDNSAPDVDGAVVQTIDEAFRRLKPFKNNIIKLASNQTHTFDTHVNVVTDLAAKGLESGYIIICDRDGVSNGLGLPTEYSPVLNWSAALISSLNVIVGGAGQGLTLNHTDGFFHAQRPFVSLGTGVQPTDVIFANCRILLNGTTPSSQLCATSGRLEIRDCAVEQNAATDRLSGEGEVAFSAINSTLSGDARPKNWDALIGKRVGLTMDQISGQFGPSKIYLYVNSQTGDDANSGFTRDQALASVNEALKRCPPGKGCHILLACGQTFTVTETYADPAYWLGSSGYIWFCDDQRELRNTPNPSDDSPHLIIAAPIRLARQVFVGGYLYPLKLTFQGIEGKFEQIHDEDGPDNGHITQTLCISFAHTEITLDSLGSTVVWGAVNADSFRVSVRNCSLVQVDSAAKLICSRGFGMAGSFHNTTSTLGGVATTWADLFNGASRPTGGGALLGISSNIEL